MSTSGFVPRAFSVNAFKSKSISALGISPGADSLRVCGLLKSDFSIAALTERSASRPIISFVIMACSTLSFNMSCCGAWPTEYLVSAILTASARRAFMPLLPRKWEHLGKGVAREHRVIWRDAERPVRREVLELDLERRVVEGSFGLCARVERVNALPHGLELGVVLHGLGEELSEVEPLLRKGQGRGEYENEDG